MDTVTLPDGTTRRLGNIDSPNGLVKAWPRFGDVPTAKVIPRAKWPDLIRAIGDGPDWPNLPPVHDQDGVGQCNADATTAMGEYIRAVQGLEYVQLSAADLYHRINGGADNGSLLEDAIDEMMRNGVGTAAACGTIWKRSGQQRATAAERARFRMLECWLCPTFDHVMSAVLQGFALNSGVMWYSNYEPAADGWLPTGRGSAGGHAIFGYKPAMKGDTFGIWSQNSWGERWGLKGRFVIPEAAYRGPVGGWFACRVMTDEGGQVPQEKA